MDAWARRGIVALLTSAIAGGYVTADAGPPAEADARFPRGGSLTVTFAAGHYHMVAGADGRRIKMTGFDTLAEPGKPALPVRRFLVALPPGARARSVEVSRAPSATLPGTHKIEPYPALLPPPSASRTREAMRELHQAWQANRDSVYQSDVHYPARVAWLAGSGTLRTVAYAAVAFCPFTYHPRSGALDYHGEVEVVIHYDLPTGEGAAGASASSPLPDPIAGRRASELFSNRADLAKLYEREAARPESATPAYRYLIITRADLADAVQASGFADWKAALGYRVRTVLTTDADIAGQPGRDLAEQIRNFLRSTYVPWGTEYVLLVGDYATVPMRICYPDPDYHVYDPGDPGLITPGTPTDHYYADLSLPDPSSWDADGDGFYGEYGQDAPDFLAEVSVGRIPVSDPARITYTLDKIAAFERDTNAWKDGVLQGGAILFFANEDHNGYPFVDGATCLATIESDFMGERPVTRFSERSGIVASPFLWPALTESSFAGAWGNGAHGVVNWSGHGWPDGVYRTVWRWDDGDGVPESRTGELASYRFLGHGSLNLDDDHPSVLFAISCDIGYPEPNPYGNFGIDLLTLPGWGPAAAVISASRPASISADWSAYPGGSESICYEFNRFLVGEGERVGDAIYDGKFFATTHYGWDHLYEYMNLYDFNLYGDPSMVVAGALPESEVTLFASKEADGFAKLEWVGGAGPVWTIGRSDHPCFEEPTTIYKGGGRAASDGEPASPVWYYRVESAQR